MNSGRGYLKPCERTVAATRCHHGFDTFDTWLILLSNPE